MMNNNKKNTYIIWLIIILLIAFFASSTSSGGSSSYGSDNKSYTCNMCGRSISRSQYVRTHGYCSSCARTLQDYLDSKDKK